MSGYMQKEYKLPNGRTVTADYNELGCAMVTIQAMDALFDILNASDVVEVVRCKDCKHRIYDSSRDLYYCHMYYGMGDVNDDNYCSYGERAEA